MVFALSGVSGQSAQAACNSDAKTIEIAVQAYINSPDNQGNTTPANIAALISTPFNNPNGNPDTFLQQAPSNPAYIIGLTGTTVTVTPVTNNTPGTKVNYDNQTAGPPATGCYAVS